MDISDASSETCSNSIADAPRGARRKTSEWVEQLQWRSTAVVDGRVTPPRDEAEAGRRKGEESAEKRSKFVKFVDTHLFLDIL